jgi:hypothetical protein
MKREKIMNRPSLQKYCENELAASPLGFGQVRVIHGTPDKLSQVIDTLRLLRPQLQVLDRSQCSQPEWQRILRDMEVRGEALLLVGNEASFQDVFEEVLEWKDTVLNRADSNPPHDNFRLFIFLDNNVHQTHEREVLKIADSQNAANE